MFALDLFNNDHERRLTEGAVDTLEQRRIDDLAMKMDDLVARAKTASTPEVKAALMKEFQKCKAERDSYYKVRTETMGYGGLTAEAGIPGNVPTEKIPGKEDLLKGKGRSYYEAQDQKKNSEQVNEYLSMASDKNFVEVPAYKNYRIYVRKKPFGNTGMYTAHTEIDRKGFMEKGGNQEEAVQAIRNRIDFVLNAQKKVTGSSTIDFNVKFATDLLADPKQTFYAKLENINGEPKLVIAGPDVASDPELLAAGDFKRSAVRNQVDDEGRATALPGIALTAKSLRAGNWIANGRYTIGNETTDSDGNRVFNLTYHSTAHTKSDKLRLNQPAFTLGTAREVDESDASDPKIDRLLTKAHREFPQARNSAEALAMKILSKEQDDVARLSRENEREDKMIDRLADLERSLQRQIDHLTPTGDLTEDQKLQVGDPIIVTAPNEFEGKTGEISELSPSGKFVIVNLYNHGEQPMHLSDVEYNQYAADQEDEDDWYDTELNEFAPSPDRDEDEVPDQILKLANRWWNATDDQPKITNVLRSLGWSIAQVESEDDAVQMQHDDGTTYFISADDFDPEVFEGRVDELSPQTLRSYIKKSKGHSQKYDQKGNKADEKGDEELANKMWNKGDNRYAGAEQARAKLAGVDEGFQDFNKVEPYAVCLAGKPVKRFDYYEDARRFHDNWKKKLYREGDRAKADKITLMPLNLDEERKGTPVPAKDFTKGVLKDLKKVNVKEQGVAEGDDSWFRVTVNTPNGKNHNIQVPANSHGTAKRKALAYCAKNGIAGAEFVSAMRMPTLDEQGVAEVSDQTLQNYKAKAIPAFYDAVAKDNAKTANKRGQGISKASHKQASRAGGSYAVHEDVSRLSDGEYNRVAAYVRKKYPGAQLSGLGRNADGSFNVMIDTGSGRHEFKVRFRDPEETDIGEGQTDYQKRRQREKDVDAGKPVAQQRQSKQTDYQKKRAQDKKDMALGEDQDTSGVESAIIRRIMIAHTDLLKQFGPEKVMQAAEEVAYNVGDVDEIGTSDVSAYVEQVRQILGA